MTETELTTLPYACFSAKATPTFEAIRAILDQAYRELLADPAYLFLAKEDFDALREAFLAATGGKKKDIEGLPCQMINQTTGRMMHLVPLPDAEPGTLLFGFFTY